jgi:hypothetical protein
MRWAFDIKVRVWIKKERARLMEDERLQSFRFREVSSRCWGRLDMKLDDGVNIHEMQCPWINT